MLKSFGFARRFGASFAVVAVAVIAAFVGVTSAGAAPVFSSVVRVPVGASPAGVAVTPDGSKVYVVNGEGSVSVIDAATNTVTATVLVGTSPWGIAITPDGTEAWVANQFGYNLSIISTATDQVIGTVAMPLDQSTDITFSPDGHYAYVTDAIDGVVSVVDVVNTAFLASAAVGSSPLGVVVTPDGNTLYVANLQSNSVSVLAAPALTPITTIATTGIHPVVLSMSADGASVYLSNWTVGGTVSIISTASNTEVLSTQVPGETFGNALSSDGKSLYVSVFDTNTLVQLDAATLAVTGEIAVDASPVLIAANPNSSTMYTSAQDANILDVVTFAAPPGPEPALASTGTNAVPFAAAGVTLLILGVGFARSAVRRRTHRSPTA